MKKEENWSRKREKVSADTLRETDQGDQVASRGKASLDCSFPILLHLKPVVLWSLSLIPGVSKCLCSASLLLTLIKFECFCFLQIKGAGGSDGTLSPYFKHLPSTL